MLKKYISKPKSTTVLLYAGLLGLGIFFYFAFIALFAHLSKISDAEQIKTELFGIYDAGVLIYYEEEQGEYQKEMQKIKSHYSAIDAIDIGVAAKFTKLNTPEEILEGWVVTKELIKLEITNQDNVLSEIHNRLSHDIIKATSGLAFGLMLFLLFYYWLGVESPIAPQEPEVDTELVANYEQLVAQNAQSSAKIEALKQQLIDLSQGQYSAQALSDKITNNLQLIINKSSNLSTMITSQTTSLTTMLSEINHLIPSVLVTPNLASHSMQEFARIEQMLETLEQMFQEIEQHALDVNLLTINASVDMSEAGALGVWFNSFLGTLRALLQSKVEHTKEVKQLIRSIIASMQQLNESYTQTTANQIKIVSDQYQAREKATREKLSTIQHTLGKLITDASTNIALTKHISKLADEIAHENH